MRTGETAGIPNLVWGVIFSHLDDLSRRAMQVACKNFRAISSMMARELQSESIKEKGLTRWYYGLRELKRKIPSSVQLEPEQALLAKPVSFNCCTKRRRVSMEIGEEVLSARRGAISARLVSINGGFKAVEFISPRGTCKLLADTPTRSQLIGDRRPGSRPTKLFSSGLVSSSNSHWDEENQPQRMSVTRIRSLTDSLLSP